MEPPDLFPSDEIILERSKDWATFMKSCCNKETKVDIKYYEIEEDINEISDDNAATNIANNNENQCKDLVKVENFETSASSYDFEDFANESIALVEEKKRKWKASGMLNVLETFDLDLINKKVIPWIEKNRLDNSRDGNNSTLVDEHIVHIEEHHHRQVHVASDDDSLHSLDTADYIRSSRRKTSCTTTTIKKICYVKGLKKHIKNKQGLYNFDLKKDLDKVVNEKNPVNLPEIIHRRFNEIPEENKKNDNATPPVPLKATTFEPRSCQVRKTRSRRMKRRSEIPKRCASSSSSSSASPPRHLIAKLKKKSIKNIVKIPPKNVLSQTKPHEENDDKTKVTILISSEESDFLTRDIVDTTLRNTKTESQLNPKIPNCNETGFLGTSVINSTALPIINQPRLPDFTNKCLISPITKKTEPSTQNQDSEDRLKVLLYCPTNIDLHKENVVNNRFKLTKEYFIETVGKKHSCRFVRLNAKKFPFEFDSKSKIYYKKYESDHSVSSDEDILYVFGREGKLIVEC